VHPYTQALLTAIPVPDPGHRLDFQQLMEGRASDPTAWPEPFRRVTGRPAQLIEVEPGHWVEASAMPPLVEAGAARMREASLAGPS
jgi:peptide/nickel transport system ATP-binding protein